MTLDLRFLFSATALAAALALPASAQDTAPAAEPAAKAAASGAAPTESAAETAPEASPALLDDQFLGAADAPLTIYEYASYTCSHCATFHQETFPKLKAEYIDTGKVRFAQRDVYFDQVGLWAGVLAHCDEQKFYPVGGMLMDTQQDWLGAKSSDEMVANLRKIGSKAGMTAGQMDACWADEGKVAQLVATFQKNATDDKIEGTPTFMIGGEQVPNMAWKDLKSKIDEKLAGAESSKTPASN